MMTEPVSTMRTILLLLLIILVAIAIVRLS
jgi:hypothetical protein